MEHILAIELMAAAQGIDFRRRVMGAETELGKGTQPVYERIRKKVPFIEEDTLLSDYLAEVHKSLFVA